MLEKLFKREPLFTFESFKNNALQQLKDCSEVTVTAKDTQGLAKYFRTLATKNAAKLQKEGEKLPEKIQQKLEEITHEHPDMTREDINKEYEKFETQFQGEYHKIYAALTPNPTPFERLVLGWAGRDMQPTEPGKAAAGMTVESKPTPENKLYARIHKAVSYDDNFTLNINEAAELGLITPEEMTELTREIEAPAQEPPKGFGE